MYCWHIISIGTILIQVLSVLEYNRGINPLTKKETIEAFHFIYTYLLNKVQCTKKQTILLSGFQKFQFFLKV